MVYIELLFQITHMFKLGYWTIFFYCLIKDYHIFVYSPCHGSLRMMKSQGGGGGRRNLQWTGILCREGLRIATHLDI